MNAEQSHSIWSLVSNASLLVQLVMLTLLVASLVSWYIIFHKRSSFARLKDNADEFEEKFWSGGEMNKIYREYEDAQDTEGLPTIFVSGFREYTRLYKRGVTRSEMVDGVHRSMRVSLSREIDSLERNLSFLATVGSTSPYVGLFGTVWGIMNSFRSLGQLEQVTIATVAPGISEALIATAMGLFAAIPAVIAYNRFAHQVERLTNRYDVFMDEFLSIVNRQVINKPS